MRKYNLHGHSFGHGHFLTKFSRPVSRAECFVFQFDNKLTVLCSPWSWNKQTTGKPENMFEFFGADYNLKIK